MARKVIKVINHPATPYVFVVTSSTLQPGLGTRLARRRRVRRAMLAMDETGQGATPDLSEILRAYNTVRRREGR
jgi:hypothetical protein